MAMNMDAMLRITANVQGENNIRKLGNSMQGMEGKVKNAALATQGLRGAVGDLVGLVGGGLIIAKIFGDTATLQSQARSLEVLTGNAKLAGQVIRELQAYGNVTPFESTELIETAKRLNAFGVEGTRVVEVTKRLGDVAGATGANIGELATAYGQVVAKGRLQGEELLQFQERGVALQQELQKMYGLSGQELQKALSSGRVSAQAVEVALERLTKTGGKYANGAIAQSDTLNGRLSTLKDTVTGLSQTLGKILEPALNRILLFATNIVNEINRAIKAAVSEPGRADVIASVQSGQLPFAGPGAVAKVIGEKRLRNLQDQAGGLLGLSQEKLIKLLQQQPEFKTSSGGNTKPTVLPPLLAPTAKEGKSAEEKTAERSAKKAAEDYNNSLIKASDLAIELTRKTRDLGLQTKRFGADAKQSIQLDYLEAMNKANDEADDLAKKTAELIKLSGGREQFQGLRSKAKTFLGGLAENAEAERRQASIDLWKDQAKAIDDATASSFEFARISQYNADAMGGLKDGMNQYIEQIGTMREAVSSLATTAFKGVEDALVSLVTTGTLNFREFAAEILKQTARMIIQQLVLKTIMQALGAIGGGGGGDFGVKGLANATNYGGATGLKFNPTSFNANGNVFGANGIVPFAKGGIVTRPTIFPFAKGIGLMGEAGPESIMPLKRGRDGKLGVIASGGGGVQVGSINISVQNSGESLSPAAQKQIAGQVQSIVMSTLVDQRRSGGVLSR